MSKSLKIFIVAGESSGDYIGAQLIKALKKECRHKLVLGGIGGELMRKEDVYSSLSLLDISTIGFFEVLPVALKAVNLLKKVSAEINRFKPDILITVDMPGFSIRLVKKLQNLRYSQNTKFVHYVSPTIWAYKKERLTIMEKLYDLVLALFPFEPALYASSSLRCEFVGHPISEYNWSEKTKNSFRIKHNIAKDTSIIGVMPGSRVTEVKKMLPIFIESINKFIDKRKKKIEVIFPIVSEEIEKIISLFHGQMNFDYHVIKLVKLEDKIYLFKSFDKVITKSGTSSIELLFAKTPMIVAYKLNFFSYLVAKYWFRIAKNIKFVTIANILAGREIVPEYLQNKCNSDDICTGLDLLYDDNFCKKQVSAYAAIQKSLSGNPDNYPSKKAAQLIIQMV